MGEYKLIDELNKCENYDIALITTFNFEFRFFERCILSALYRNNIKKISLFIDSKELSKALKEITDSSIGRKYMVNPIEMSGAFHPKLILLLGQNKAKLFVMSANLTTNGYLINNEIFNTFEYNEEHPENLKVIDSAIKFFMDINQMSFKQDEALFEEIKKLIYYNKPTNNDDLFLIHNINKSIIEQARNIILEAESIDIAVPYYDNHLGALESVYNSFPQAEINLYIQNLKSKFPLEYKDIEAINKIIVFNGFNDRKSAAFYHGKVFRFKAKDISYVLYGSINCTQSALTKIKENGNVECAILEKGSIDEFDYFFDNFRLDSEKDLQCEILSLVSENKFNYYYKYGVLEVDLKLYLGYTNKKDSIKVKIDNTELFYEYLDEMLTVNIPPVIASGITDIFTIKIIYGQVEEEVNCWYINRESLEINRTKEASDALSRFTFDNSGDNDKYLEDRVAILKEWILSVDDYRKKQEIIDTVEHATQQYDDETDEESGIISFVIPPADWLKQYEKYQLINSIKSTYIREYFKSLKINSYENNNGNGVTQKNDNKSEIKARPATSREISFRRFVKSRIKEMSDGKFVELVSFEHYLASLLVFINIFEKYTIKEHVAEMFDEKYIVDTKILLLNKLLDKDLDAENKEIVEATKVITIQSIIENKYLSKNDIDDMDFKNRALLKKLNELFNIRQEFEDIVCIAINNINSYVENELSESSVIKYVDELFGYLPQNRLEDSIRSDYGKDAEISIIDDCITIRTETDRIGDFMLAKECSLGELKKLYSIKKMPRYIKIEIVNHNINPKYPDPPVEIKFDIDLLTRIRTRDIKRKSGNQDIPDKARIYNS